MDGTTAGLHPRDTHKRAVLFSEELFKYSGLCPHHPTLRIQALGPLVLRVPWESTLGGPRRKPAGSYPPKPQTPHTLDGSQVLEFFPDHSSSLILGISPYVGFLPAAPKVEGRKSGVAIAAVANFSFTTSAATTTPAEPRQLLSGPRDRLRPCPLALPPSYSLVLLLSHR